MSIVAYHLLTEAEPFSEFHGGAISRWAANVLRTLSGSTGDQEAACGHDSKVFEDRLHDGSCEKSN